MIRKHFRLLITLLWIILLGILLSRNLFIPKVSNNELALIQKAKQERFYGIWFNNKRIGYVEEHLEPVDEGFDLDQKAFMVLNVLDTTQPINMKLEAQLSDNLVMKKFNFSFSSPFYTMSATGYTSDNTVHFELDTGQSIIKDAVTLSGPPLLAINDRSYLLKELQETGKRIKIPSFDPISLNARESLITYYGKETVLINKRVKSLHHYSETTGGIRINFWLDDQGRIVKEESPAGFHFIAEPEFRAKDIVDPGNELLSAVAIQPTGPLFPQNAASVSYKLSLPDDIDFDIQGGRQTFTGNILSLTREQFPASVDTKTTDKCEAANALQPSRYVQSDMAEIKQRALSIVGSEKDPARQVRLLAGWLYENVEKRPVLGLPDALTTLRNLKGDCNEHASLFAALARSINIPTTIATGVTLQNKAFYYHAWNEVCLGGQWYSLDTTTNQIPADVYHIRFGKGDLEEQLKIGGLLGRLTIEFLPQQK